MLSAVLAESMSVDEFVHGLFAFLEEMAADEPDHPALSALVDDVGRGTAEALAAGRMHDVRGLLQVIRTRLDLMQDNLDGVFGHRDLDPNQQAKLFGLFVDGIAHAQEATVSAAEIANGDLRSFLGGKLPAELSEIVETAVGFGRAMLSKRVDVVLESVQEGKLAAVRADVLRVMLNLIRNAGDAAMSEIGGMVVVSSWKSHDHVFVRVRDNGPGIDPQHLDHIFELFYTTKGHGTGVGLFVCKRLVEGWGGRIQVESKRGSGASFTISVPLEATE
jgi:signal transduction histidine kinase